MDKVMDKIKKGLYSKFLLLEKKDIKVGDNQSIDIGETSEALNDYIFNGNDGSNQITKVVSRKKNKMKVWPIVLAALMTMMLGTRIKNNNVSSSDLENCVDISYTLFAQNDEIFLSDLLSIDDFQYLDIEEKDILNNYEEGVPLQEMSIVSESINPNISEMGLPVIHDLNSSSYISNILIVDNGVEVNLTLEKKDNLKVVIDNYCKTNGKTLSDLKVWIKVVNEQFNSFGWIELNELINNMSNNNAEDTKVTLYNQYKYDIDIYGYNREELIDKLSSSGLPIMNIEGNAASKEAPLAGFWNKVIEGDNESLNEFRNYYNGVNINVVDKNGNLLPNGSIIKGNDGLEYRLVNISLKEEKSDSDKLKYNISWGIQNYNQEKALLAAAIGIVGVYFANKKEQENDVKSR